MRLGEIVEDVIEALTGRGHDEEEPQNVRPASEDPMGDPADQGWQRAGYSPGNVRPASEDPMGDPADTYNGQQVLSASQDPMGDPEDTYNGQQVLPASQDPLGDPADQR